MISLRKQLFTIFISIGLIMVFTTSMLVNFIVKKNFSMYVESNVEYASRDMVQVIQKLYSSSETGLDKSLIKKTLYENYMGHFSISLLNNDKKMIYGLHQNTFKDFLQAKYSFKIDNKFYSEKDWPLKDRSNKTVGYVRIGYYPSSTVLENDIKFQSDVRISMVWCSSMILMWFVFAGLYVSRLFTYHIYGISKTSISLADGKLDARYPFKSKIKEIETLRHSMNYLGEKLQKQDEIRKKLISDVSHEIRTPLQVLQSNLEAMIDGIYPIDEEQMNVLYKEVVRFGKLLNNLDLLKNIEENSTSVKLRVINLNESIQDVFDSFKIIAKENKINYHIKMSDTERVMVSADPDALKQLWMNLLSNAFKFTSYKGEIKVYTNLCHKFCKIIIQDSGIGIAEEDLPFVFERMYRGDKSREQYQGSGIGLTMVKTIVEKHKGTVQIDSVEGEYTRVVVTLPVRTLMLEPNNISSKMKSYIKIGKNKE